MMQIFISLIVLLFSGAAQAQVFMTDHSNAAGIQSRVTVLFTGAKNQLVTERTKYGKYIQLLKTPAVDLDGLIKKPKAEIVIRFPSDTEADAATQAAAANLIPADGALFNFWIDEYVGPFGTGYTLRARVTQPNTDGNCVVWHLGGEPCVWEYFEHVGPETYRNSGALAWRLTPHEIR